MRTLKSILLAASVCAFSTAALAAPNLDLRGAAVRLVVIPEARNDILIAVSRSSNALPLRIHTFGRNTFVVGDVGHRIHACVGSGPRRGVSVWGRGDISYDELPVLVARTPMDVKISAGDAVFGEIGRSGSLDLTNRGCGDWTVGNVAGMARINQAGSGDTRAGGAGQANLSVAGSGNIGVQAVRGGVTAVSAGSGDITVASVQGPLDVRIAGSGDVNAKSGAASNVHVSIAGSGSVAFGGVAKALNASIAGSGDVAVARVDGPVVKHVFGSGEVSVGR